MLKRVFPTILSLVVCLSAMALPPGGDEYVVGRAADMTGKHADARKQYLACAEKDGPLQAYALLRAAKCLIAAGDYGSAAAELKELLSKHPEGAWVAPAHIELAQALSATGHHADAARHYAAALNGALPRHWTERYQMEMAECLAKSPDTKAQAYALWRPIAESSRSKDRRLESARKLAGSTSDDDLFAAAYTFIRYGLHKEAKGLVEAQSADSARWGYLHGRLALAKGETDKGLGLLGAVAKAHPDTEWARLSISHQARALSGAGRKAEARAAVDLLVSKHPESEEAGDALWSAANEESGDRKEAVKLYLRLAKDCAGHYRADDALMAAAGLQRDMGDLKGAIESLGRLADEFPDSSLVAEALYIRGTIRLAQGDKSEAAGDFRRGALGEVGNFHVHRCLERLVRLDEKSNGMGGAKLSVCGEGTFVRPLPLAKAEVSSGNGTLPDTDWAERLAFFGARGFEEGEWEAIHLLRTAGDEAQAEALHGPLAECGYSAIVVWLAPEPAKLAAAAPLQFPRVYWAEVCKVAKENDLDPYLVLAMARQESFFRASAVSSVGARGVMQLMPDTAKWLAGVEPSISNSDVADLGHPANSLKLGACYMGRMLERSDGNLIYALASYNAGPGSVSKWRKRFPGKDGDDFIEAIPFQETRGFVKRVLGNYAAYHSLYSADAGELAGRD